MSTSKRTNQHYGVNELKADIACIDRVQKIIMETSKIKDFMRDVNVDNKLILDLENLKSELEATVSLLTSLDTIGKGN